MTRQEAIKILEHLKPSNQVYNANDAYAVGQALCMAINSLEVDEAYRLEYEKPDEVEAEDCISRKEVLVIIKQIDYAYSLSKGYELISHLPTVYPKSDASYCKLVDCIDREYTAKYVEEFANNEYVSEHEAETIYLIAEGVRHIPTAYPKSDKPSGKC